MNPRELGRSDLKMHQREPAAGYIVRLCQPVQALRLASFFGFFIVVQLTFGAQPAKADLRLCNKTQALVGIAIGYKGREDWVSEGWWNIAAETCQIVVEGALPARYYYVYGVDYELGGEWSGTAHMCTSEKEFTIESTGDCLARGFERTGFVEVDTGDQASWTVQLTEKSKIGIGGR